MSRGARSSSRPLVTNTGAGLSAVPPHSRPSPVRNVRTSDTLGMAAIASSFSRVSSESAFGAFLLWYRSTSPSRMRARRSSDMAP
ncbi:hypothetical protein R5W23_003042 [Gemmata sp. JC673]|uniref:Uncharacterized protein n=1 Tax=Gemmata algarum TaxID=2975278 RepID=A0ABU5ETH3_9BACT|nr:hypothetical protein [Gemmata algarum]MDY3557777.1 hypothetical protein [Gemmata algarum]